jgi:cytochrome c-type biogenesis protein CcmH
VCQNQSIDDSNAALAHDLRVLVRQRITAGDSDKAVIAYLVARYGDFVLLRPPVKPATWLLWFGPGILLVLGAGFLVLRVRRRRSEPPTPATLDDDERQKLARLIGEAKP